ncbi:hypothetical protein M9458_002982 [Cirrhinus mrigala]|uniref:Uncharacterized protein n=1 Tax=Cirrhinus mrigala TaxID=683832 RepID=A0ABD0RNU7_CIRMR
MFVSHPCGLFSWFLPLLPVCCLLLRLHCHRGPPAPPGSLVPLAPPWSVVIPPSPQGSTPPAAPRCSVPPAPLGSSLPPAPPQSSVAPALLRTSGALGSALALRILGVAQDHRLSASGSTSTCFAAVALPPPWLLPPSAPPWATIMAAAWVSPGSSCSESILSPPWLLPPFDPPWTLLPPPWLLPPSEPPWTLFVVLLPGVHPPPEPPPTLTFCYHPTSPPLFLFFLRHEVVPA